MGIVLGKLPDPQETVQYTTSLVPMHLSQFEIPYRQIPIAPDFRLIDQHVGKAIHRFQGIISLVHAGKIHELPVIFKVSGLLP